MPCDRVSAERRCVGVTGTTSRAGPSTLPMWELPGSFSPLGINADKCHDLRALMEKIVEPQDKKSQSPKSPLGGEPSASQEGSLSRARNKY